MGELSLWNRNTEGGTFGVDYVSTPHGRAVPVELVPRLGHSSRSNGFNPSWESRPCGTYTEEFPTFPVC